MKKQNKLKIGYLIKGYLAFPIATAGLLLVLGIVFILISRPAGIATLIVFAVYSAFAVLFIVINTKRLKEGLIKFARSYENAQREMIADFPLPYAVADVKGDILLCNANFSKFYSPEDGQLNICDLFHEISPKDLDFEGKFIDISIVYDSRNYRVNIRKLKIDKRIIDKRIALPPRSDLNVYAIYLFDETEIVNVVRQTKEEEMVVASIYIDNYEETVEQVTDVKKSLVIAMLDREINKYFQDIGGIVRKMEKDRYFVAFKHRYLAKFQRDKFEILDNIKKIDTGTDISATLSIGIGVGDDYLQNSENARLALELALGRGGDQAVIRDNERIYYYGGKTKQAEKNTKVKARVKATALKEILGSVDKVVIMSHKVCDIDGFGAAMGIYRAAKTLGKSAYVVLNNMNNSVKPILSLFREDEEYKQAFIRNTEAQDYVDENTALIIVDANSAERFECPDLPELTRTTVLIDHHRQGLDHLEKVSLLYQEPSASSASEMVTELLRYISGGIKLKKIEAEALFAGMLIDTDYFSKNTGVRTFEAAAYLKKYGIDISKIRSFFNDSFAEMIAKASALRTTRMLNEEYAIAVCKPDGLDNPTIVAAQVANDLLKVNEVKASFVLIDVEGVIHISARSESDVNVQLVMERMGGGGHMNIAGAQIKDSTISETRKNLIITIKKMIEEEIL